MVERADKFENGYVGVRKWWQNVSDTVVYRIRKHRGLLIFFSSQISAKVTILHGLSPSWIQWRRSEFILRGRNFQLHREGDKGSPRAEARGPKPEARRAESGSGVLGRGQRAPSPPARVCGSAVSSPSGKFEIWCNLRPQNSRQKCLISVSY